MSIATGSRKAWSELLALLAEIDERWAGPEWNLQSADEIALAHRALAHILEGGLTGTFEGDPGRPLFRQIVTPTRKFTGDNSDAIYFDAPISARHRYVVRGEMRGAVYVSMTIEIGSELGDMPTRTGGVLNDDDFDVDSEGRFEIHLGGEPRARNWLALPEGASRITTRHYFEEEQPAAADPWRVPRMSISALDAGPPPATPCDESVAAGLRRVARFVRSRTLDQPSMADAEVPPFVSKLPNRFPQPVRPGDFGLAAFDAAYSMAPYLIGPEHALVMTGRWPRCRFANVCLWTRHQQTYDFANRRVSLNRKQTQLEPDGSFRMVLAHRDPGVPNWIDTEGRPFGIVFWRFMLHEGEIETPRAELVPFADVASPGGAQSSR